MLAKKYRSKNRGASQWVTKLRQFFSDGMRGMPLIKKTYFKKTSKNREASDFAKIANEKLGLIAPTDVVMAKISGGGDHADSVGVICARMAREIGRSMRVAGQG